MKKISLIAAVVLGVGLGSAIIIDASTRTATLPPYDTTADIGKIPIIASSGFIGWGSSSAASGGVSGPAASTNHDVVAFSGTGGHTLIDSGVPYENIVLVSRAIQAGTGLTVTNSGLLSADITMSVGPNQLQLAMLPTGVSATSVLGVTGATGINYSAISATTNGNVLRRSSGALGFGTITLNDSTNTVTGVLPIGNGGTSGATAGSGFANLSPQTTKGDLVSYSTVPLRVAVGTTGQVLQADSTAAGGISWTTDTLGVTTNSNAAAGYVGEYISNVLGSVGATGLTTSVAKNITQISLSAGDWDVSGVGCIAGTLTGTVFTTGVSAVSGTRGTIGDSELGTPTLSTVASSSCLPIPAVRASISATTTYYLVTLVIYTIGSATGYGRISARRVR